MEAIRSSVETRDKEWGWNIKPDINWSDVISGEGYLVFNVVILLF